MNLCRKTLFLAGLLLALLMAGPQPGPAQTQTPEPPTKKEEPQDVKLKKAAPPKAPQAAPLMDKSPRPARARIMTPEAQRSSTRRMGGAEIRAKEGEEKD